MLADVIDAFLITKTMLENVSWEWLDVQSNGISGKNANEQPSINSGIHMIDELTAASKHRSTPMIIIYMYV